MGSRARRPHAEGWRPTGRCGIGACLAAVVLLLGACAQVRELSGGPKDEQGPQLAEAIPPNGAVRFAGDRIILRFDERIRVQKPAGGLLVSPPMDPPPTLALTGPRQAEVRWKAPLLPNTTYSLAVGEAIADLAEGNPAAGLAYAFSTGDALDSLQLAGTVADAFTQAPEPGVLVLAYAADDTASFTGGRPAYATRSDAQGRFTLRHLPDAAFRLMALKDLNGNYRFDLPGEAIAFTDAPLAAHAPGDSLDGAARLRLFQERSPVQRIASAAVTDDRAWRIVLARPAERIALRDLAREGGRLGWIQEWSAGRDTVVLWPTDTTALGEGRFEIGTEAGPLDTLRYRPLRPMPYLLTVRQDRGAAPGEARLIASRPLAQVDEALIRITAGEADIPFAARIDSAHARTAIVIASGAFPAEARLTLLPKALRDLYGGTHDTVRIALGARAADAYGILRVTLAGEGWGTELGVLELVDARGTAVRRMARLRPGGKAEWEQLEPGAYTLRLIGDADGNGRWDTGDWKARRQPEPVLLHADPVQVRAGWDLGVEWKLQPE